MNIRENPKYPYAEALSKEAIRDYITETIADRINERITHEEYCVRMGKAIAYAEAGWLIGELSKETALDFVITAETRIK